MACLAVLTLIGSFITTVIFAIVNFITRRSSKTEIDWTLLQDGYWSNEPGRDDQTVREFKINVSDDLLNDLKGRLSKSRIFNSLDNTNFEYGMRSDVLKRIVDYWMNSYDWRKIEGELNQLPHFKTTIEGIDIHFIHVKAKRPTRESVPILLVHGWPGSFVEYVKSIPHLEENYNLVIPSIPGYGFSDAPEKPGCGTKQIARIFVKLMRRLGYFKFVYHGGDWGSLIGNEISMIYPAEVMGFHCVLPIPGRSLGNTVKLVLAMYMPNWVYGDSSITQEQKLTLGSVLKFAWREMGYAHIQGTKPDTIGYGLTDSPTGLAAYILEKFSTWTDPSNIERSDGGLFDRFTMDELITNVMIYWINGNITSSIRLYKESILGSFEDRIITVPTGLCPGRYELLNYSKSMLENSFKNIVHYNNRLQGGHFLFYEIPHEACDDLKNFIQKLKLSN